MVRGRLILLVRASMRASLLARRLGSDVVYQQLKGTALRWARWRAPRVTRAKEIDPHKMGDLCRIQDWEDAVVGVTGHWSERDDDRALRHETHCPYADLAAQDPRICTDLVHALETETFRAVQPGYRLVPLSRLLSRGDDECVFEHRIER